jgi:hypothetical protein
MALLILDEDLQRRLIAERKRTDGDRYDEVWDGVRVMSPLADDQHQLLQCQFSKVFQIVIGDTGRGQVRPGVNISDREKMWKKNYRVPDVVVFLKGTTAKNCSTHWMGGPDFVVEITSPGDRSRDKLPFYSKIGTKEFLIVDRNRWQLELYRLKKDELKRIGDSHGTKPAPLVSKVLPFHFRLLDGDAGPQIEITNSEDSQQWLISTTS